MAKSRATAVQIVRANLRMQVRLAHSLTTHQTTFYESPLPQTSPFLRTHRRSRPLMIPDADVHASIASFTRHAADASGLADKVHYDLMAFPALDEIYIQRCNFGAT
jgi:hypothetical protein